MPTARLPLYLYSARRDCRQRRAPLLRLLGHMPQQAQGGGVTAP